MDTPSEPVKKCSRCKVESPVSQYGRDPRNRSGLRSECRACRKMDNARYIPARGPRHRHRNPEQTRAYLRLWRERNQDKKKAYDTERRQRLGMVERGPQPYGHLSAEERRVVRRAYDAKREAVKRQTAVGPVDYLGIRAAGDNCGICGKYVADADLSFDHIMPLSRGGSHTQDNIQVAHKSCNFRKGNKVLEGAA